MRRESILACVLIAELINHYNSIGSWFSDPQVAGYHHLPLTGGIALVRTNVLHCENLEQSTHLTAAARH